jgi:MFS transporter, UMF1 family
MTPTPVLPAALDRRAIAAWCVYDWANSAFPAVITTFVFATYFTQAVAPDPVTGTTMWGHALAGAGFVIAVLSPVLGSIADYTGRQKLWLAIFTALTAVAIAALWFVEPSPDSIPLALVGIAVATIGFEIATVFYNALLPSVAPPAYIGRVSGWAWGLGYVGGIVCLALILVLFVQADRPLFGLDKATAEHVRVAGPFSALWYAAFILPLFLFVREPQAERMPLFAAARKGLVDLAGTLATLKDHGPVAWFLLANMVYTDGLTTLFAFGGVYAAGTFGMKIDEVIVFGIALNVTAGIGAFAFAWIDDWIGARRTISIGLAALILVGAGLLLVESKTWFWGLGLLLGAFFGPVQAASRSLAARMAPPQHRAQMFGLFALSGRITTFLGPAVLAWATYAAGNQRAGMATILVFLSVGLALLLKVPEPPHGAAAAR